MAFDVPEYSKVEFQDLLYPIFEVPEGKSIIKHIKQMDFAEFKLDLDPFGFEGVQGHNMVIQYIACVYDRNSPFVSDYSDATKRKMAAAAYVGFELSKDTKFEPHVEMMMTHKFPEVTLMIFLYIRNQHDHDWALLKTIEENYYKQLPKLTKGDLDIKDLNMVKTLKKEMDSLINEMLAGDRSRDLEGQLYEHLDKERIRLRPEDIAEMLMKEKDGGESD